MAERIPRSWTEAVKRAVLPELTELRHGMEAISVKVDAVGTKVDSFRNELSSFRNELSSFRNEVLARFETVNTRIDALERRLPMVEEVAGIRARLDELEKKVAGRP